MDELELLMSQVVFLSGELSCDSSEKTKSSRDVALCEGIIHTILLLFLASNTGIFSFTRACTLLDCLGVSGAT